MVTALMIMAYRAKSEDVVDEVEELRVGQELLQCHDGRHVDDTDTVYSENLSNEQCCRIRMKLSNMQSIAARLLICRHTR